MDVAVGVNPFNILPPPLNVSFPFRIINESGTSRFSYSNATQYIFFRLLCFYRLRMLMGTSTWMSTLSLDYDPLIVSEL